MKRILTLAALAAITLAASAQDLQKATELAKQANEALMNSDFKTAIDNFTAAAGEAAQCTEEEAAALMASCKTGIAQANYSLANNLISDGKLEEAIAQLETTVKASAEAEEQELIQKSEEKTLQLHKAIANAKIKAASAEADAAAKAAAYKDAIAHLDAVLAKEAEDGKVFIQKGQVLGAMGDKAAAVESFLKAKELGEDKAADKQLSTIFLKEASAKLKAKDLKGAIDAAMKSNEYLESANAYKIAGTAANSLKDIASAEKYLSKYLELAPNAKDAAQIKAAVAALQAALSK